MRTVSIVATFAVAAASLVPVVAAEGQTQAQMWASADRQFYLHIQQYCEKVSVIRFIDEFDWSNDLDGCGGDVTATDSTWTDNYYAPKFHANVTTETTGELHIFLLSRAVDQTSVSFTIDLGYAQCKGNAPAQTLVQEKATGFTEFKVPCTFEVKGAPDPLARPNLTTVVTATHSYGVGVEDPHASYVKIAGVSPAPPQEDVKVYAENERPVTPFEEEDIELVAFNNTQAKGPAKSPGLDSVATLAAVGLVAVAAFTTRRRIV
jgi:hypothetical protein